MQCDDTYSSFSELSRSTKPPKWPSYALQPGTSAWPIHLREGGLGRTGNDSMVYLKGVIRCALHVCVCNQRLEPQHRHHTTDLQGQIKPADLVCRIFHALFDDAMQSKNIRRLPHPFSILPCPIHGLLSFGISPTSIAFSLKLLLQPHYWPRPLD
jgi:hypothetical protein